MRYFEHGLREDEKDSHLCSGGPDYWRALLRWHDNESRQTTTSTHHAREAGDRRAGPAYRGAWGITEACRSRTRGVSRGDEQAAVLPVARQGRPVDTPVGKEIFPSEQGAQPQTNTNHRRALPWSPVVGGEQGGQGHTLKN